MLASRLRIAPIRSNSGLIGQNKRPDSQARDCRSVEAVVQVAAATTGEAESVTAIVKALSDLNVLWAWQLRQASDAHWARFGASLGLELAIKAELASPSSGATLSRLRPEDVPPRLRRFLLIPDVDGGPPRRLYAFGALIFGLLTVPPHDRQNLVITVLELLALVSGLLLPIPFEKLQRFWMDDLEGERGWAVLPTTLDFQKALATICFASFLFVCVFSIFTGLYIAAAGHRASLQFYENAMPALSYLIATLVFGGTWPMLGLIFWNVLIAANSPIPVICAVLVTLGFASLFLTILNYFSTIEMALELYHLPRYMMLHFAVLIPWLRHRLTDEALRPGAERRAAELRALLGMEVNQSGASHPELPA